MLNADWSKSQLTELDLTSTELSENALIEFFSKIQHFSYLSVAFCDGFTDKVRRKKTELLILFESEREKKKTNFKYFHCFSKARRFLARIFEWSKIKIKIEHWLGGARKRFDERIFDFPSIYFNGKNLRLFQVFRSLIERGTLNNCRALDLSNTVNLSAELAYRFFASKKNQILEKLEALSLTGQPTINEQFWVPVIKNLERIR